MIGPSNISVQLDLDLVPRPAALASHEEASFADSLQDATKSLSQEPAPRQPDRVDSRNPETPRDATQQQGDTNSRAAGKTIPDQGEGNLDAARAALPVSGESTADGTASQSVAIPGEGPGRRIQPGKGSGSSSTFSATAAPGLGPTKGNTATPVAPVVGLSQATTNVARPTGAAEGGMVKPVGEATHTLRSATKASHPGVTGFKTYNAQAMELESKTRDSMFKKIALKLLPNGGEMRMRLDPPHLGTLDVGLVVEKGVVVKLSLAAERSDVANMLERHLPDLKQYLQDMGLSVKHAEVVTQDFHRRGEHQGQQHDDKPSFGDTEDQEQEHQHPAPLRQAGYLTQDGLDFWV